jgi:hypothetical protein
MCGSSGPAGAARSNKEQRQQRLDGAQAERRDEQRREGKSSNDKDTQTTRGGLRKGGERCVDGGVGGLGGRREAETQREGGETSARTRYSHTVSPTAHGLARAWHSGSQPDACEAVHRPCKKQFIFHTQSVSRNQSIFYALWRNSFHASKHICY